MSIRNLFLLFVMYSIIGWSLEVVNCYIRQKKWINRGFLIGPYCPIYGFGSILMTLLIPQTNDLVSTFLKSMAICSILEYITSYLMEKLFKTRWWDYSNKPFNFNGRVCLEGMLDFGIGGLIIVELASPAFLFDLNLLPNYILNILMVVSAIMLLTDLVISYNVINSFKEVPAMSRKDSTEDITKMVRKTLTDKNYLYNRLVNSFPNFQSLNRKYDRKIARQLRKLERDKVRLRQMKKKGKKKN